jgi:putative transposase
MTKKVTQTIRYKIVFDKALYKLLDDISYAVWRVKNKATSMAYDWQQFSFSYNERLGEYPSDKELLGVGHIADVSRNTKELAPFVSSRIVDTAAQLAVKKFKEMRKDIAKGNKSAPTYRRDGSFPMRAQAMKDLVRISANKYEVKLALLSREGAKERQTTSQQAMTLQTGNGANVILDRIINRQYKLCDSNIVKRKSAYYLMVAYQFTPEKATNLVDDNIMGIDLGVVNAAAIAFNNEDARYFIEGNEISHFRAKVEARRNAMLRQGKYCGEGRKGHGRKTLLKPIEKLRGKVENFRNTTNHRYARYIVDMATKHQCATIQMEDLSGIAADSLFLKRWTYYDLQTKIEQKAKVAGITVKKVSPKYTSQRCSCCGYIAEDNRKTQKDFKCVACGFTANADYNAAKNIAERDIEAKIKTELLSERKVG